MEKELSQEHVISTSRLTKAFDSRVAVNDLRLEVLTRIARGRSNHEIAQDLVISEPTVRTHMANILSKLHLTDRTQAAIYALRQRLVPLKDALEKEE